MLSPQLLRWVYADIIESPGSLQRTRSLSAFLVRHAAPHVQQLGVHLEAHSRGPAELALVQAALVTPQPRRCSARMPASS